MAKGMDTGMAEEGEDCFSKHPQLYINSQGQEKTEVNAVVKC